MRAELARRDLGRDALVNDEREELRRRVLAAERRLVVEVAEVQRGEHFAQASLGAADVDDDAVGVELGAAELDVDDVGRAVQLLRGAEHLPLEAVRDHEVVADGDAEHAAVPLNRRCDESECNRATRPAARARPAARRTGSRR